MRLPDPYPGLVISYAYLWSEEHRRGLEDGTKDRPCVVVVARRWLGEHIVATVVPVTHRKPATTEASVELPAVTKSRLGLDSDRSWVVLDETNEFLWPGPDLRPARRSDTPSTAQSRYVYGPLPPKLFQTIRTRLLAIHEQGHLTRVRRSE